jgi:Cdc6-like AAA superfamily ATPase
MTTADNFGLKRPNFILDPAVDSECFARVDINPGDLSQTLQIDLLTEVAPKRMFWGAYGAGKTHTLYATVHILSEHIPVYPVHIECPDLGRTSTFNDFYRDGIMRTLGESFTVGLLEKYVMAKPPKPLATMLTELTEELHDEAFATAVMKLYNPAFSRLTFWSWISGVPIKANELRDLGQTQDLTAAEPSTLANILITLADVLKRVENKSLVLVLDELERMRRVGPESMQTFLTAFTRLTDLNQKSLAVLFGVSATQLTEAPEIFSGETPVTSRIGGEGTIRIKPMNNDEVPDFIRKIIKYVRNESFDAESAARQAEKEYNESFDPEFFPFSDAALGAMRSKIGQKNTPREITYAMTRSLGRAMLAGLTAIPESAV